LNILFPTLADGKNPNTAEKKKQITTDISVLILRTNINAKSYRKLKDLK